MLTNKQKQKMKELFSVYCRGEINAGRCDDDDCEFCSVDHAYDKIFDEQNSDKDWEEFE